MAGQHWSPLVRNPSTQSSSASTQSSSASTQSSSASTQSSSASTQSSSAASTDPEPQTPCGSPGGVKPVLSHLRTVACLAALCSLLLLICTALGILYNRESNGKPESKSLLSEYQSARHHYTTASASAITASDANVQLRRENQNLSELVQLRRENQNLSELVVTLNTENTLLTRNLSRLAAFSLTSETELVLLRESLANLTDANVRLKREAAGAMTRLSAQLEEEKTNGSRAISVLRRSNAMLTDSLTQLRGERRNLSDTNVFLAAELERAAENDGRVQRSRLELLELSGKLRGERQNLTEEVLVLRGELEEVNENNARLQKVSMSQKQKQNQTGAQLQREMEKYHSLDVYCPVVDQRTQVRRCRECGDGWTLFQSKCYHFSTDTRTWGASRVWCLDHGADLLIVNSEQEQRFVFEASQRVVPGRPRLWIGLTDAEEEGRWLWVDRSPTATGLQYWVSRAGAGQEPDDWRLDNPLGEDCGHIDTLETELSCWMDGSCDAPYRWICEKDL